MVREKGLLVVGGDYCRGIMGGHSKVWDLNFKKNMFFLLQIDTAILHYIL